MEASVVDLRYRMNEVLKALERNEDVSIFCRGKLRGTLKASSIPSPRKVTEHSFFNMLAESDPVEKQMDHLRGERHRAL